MIEGLLGTELAARVAWRLRWGGRRPVGRPPPLAENAVLQSRAEWEDAVRRARDLGLPPYHDGPKNWDSLIALSAVLRRTGPEARVLDAGSDRRAVLLPWLALHGYRRLTGINLVFRRRTRVGPIVYLPGDVTATGLETGALDAVTCLSVIEHGVDLDAYFREMARVLRVGGVLVTSTDYWETPVDAGGRTAWGAPVRVLTRADVEEAFRLAATHGLRPTGPIDLGCRERAVHWRRQDLRFTFAVFTMERCRVQGLVDREP